MTHAIEFIETPIFTRQIKELATDDELKELQVELICSPEKGVLIKNTGRLRKIRMPNNSKGKSSGIRVIYFIASEQMIFLVLAYHKSKKTNLTEFEKIELKKLTKLLKKEV
ncbi:type II toxin-antitoxin system RelE/ParE family toxin [Thorsellia kenyensis]|uniref:Type II toxin-antitoxin system RelE/ParE family toxin n=1 Tax=Thorsellia kenyensis TaxID=1549888 RepID=A0ABV6CCY2_9GAMM